MLPRNSKICHKLIYLKKTVHKTGSLLFIILAFFVMGSANVIGQTARIFVQGSIQTNGATINVCKNSNVLFKDTSLSATGRDWTFKNGNPIVSNAAQLSVTFNTIGLDTAFLTALGSTNNTTYVLVNVIQIPDSRLDTTGLDYAPLQGIFLNCFATKSTPNFNWTVINNSSTSSSNTHYTINWGDGTTDFSNSTFTITNHTYTSVGFFNVSLTTSNSTTGCSTLKTYNLFNGNTPAGGLFNPGNINDCVPYTFSWPVDTAGTNQNAPGTTYLFSVNDSSAPQSFTQANLPLSISHTFTRSSCNLGLASNSFTISFIISNPCDPHYVTSPGTARVSQKPIANFTSSPDSTVCLNSLATLTNSSLGNYFNGTVCQTAFEKTWSVSPSSGWSLNSGVLAPNILAPIGSNSISLAFTTAGIYSVKLKITKPASLNVGRCTDDSITKNICVQPVPAPNFTLSQNPLNACRNNVITVVNSSNTLSSCGVTNYNWIVYDSTLTTSVLLNPGSRFNFISGTDSSSINPVIVFNQKGRYKIRLQIINHCNGFYYKDTTIIVKDKPVISFPADQIYCDTQLIVFDSTNAFHGPVYDSSFGAISSYNWSINPVGALYMNGNGASRNPSVLFPNSSTLPIIYTVILNATNECGISIADTQLITIKPKPLVTAVPNISSFCSGDSVSIALSCNLSGGISYTWKAFPSSTALSGYSGQLSGVLGPINQTLLNAGGTTETVTYKITAIQSTTGCGSDSVSVPITVYPIPKAYANNQSICNGTNTNIALSSNVSGSMFTWTASLFSGTVTGFSSQNTGVTGPLIQPLSNATLVSGSVKYVLKAIANSCTSPDSTIYTTVNPTPAITNTVLTQNFCSGDTAKFIPSFNFPSSTDTYTATLLSGNATGFSNGSGNISQRLINNGTSSAVVRYRLTPSGPAPTNCTGTPVDFMVTVSPMPVISITPADTICSGSQTNIVLSSNTTGTNYTWIANLVSGVNTTGYASQSVAVNGPILQTITNNGTINAIVNYQITPVLSSCAGIPQNHAVTIFPGVVPGTTGPAAVVCSGTNSGNVSLTGNTGNVLRWEYSVAPFSSWQTIFSTSTTVTYTNLTQSTRFRAIIQSGSVGLCNQVPSPFTLITVDSISAGGTVTGTDTVCISGNNGTIQLNNHRGAIVRWEQTSNLSGSWNTIPSSSNTNPYTYNNITQTTFYRAIVQNGVCNAAVSDSVRIQVDLLPSPAVTSNTNYCLITNGVPVTGSLLANPLTLGTGLWRLLSGPGIAGITKADTNITPVTNLLNGNYYFEWKVSNGKCPSNLDTALVIVYPALTIGINASQIICSSQSPALLTSTSAAGGNGTYTYQWQLSTDGTNFNNISGAVSSTYQPGVLTADKWYRLMVFSLSCSFTSITIFIQVLPPITNNNIAQGTSICIGNAAPVISGSTPSGGNTTYSFQWQKYNGSSWISTSSADTLKDYNPGILPVTSEFKRLVTSGACAGPQASASNSDTITVNLLPFVNAGPDLTKCLNQTSFLLGGTPSGGTWTGTGVISGNSFNPSAMSLGLYSLIYNYTHSSTGCSNRDTAIITVDNPPVVSVGSDFSICENASGMQLTGFSPAGGIWSGPGISTAGFFTPSLAGSGSKYLIYTFTTSGGCVGKDSVNATVFPGPGTDFILPVQICPNTILNLSAITNSAANINAYSWTVTNTGGFSNAILSSLNNALTTASIPENKTMNDVMYSIKLFTSTNNSCADSITKNIVLRRRPLAQFSSSTPINCGPAVYTMNNSTGNITSNYVWSANPGTAVNINNINAVHPQITLPVNTSNSSIIYSVQLIAQRNDTTLGCRDTVSQNFIIYPKPQAAFTISPLDSGCAPLNVSLTNNSNPKNGEPISSMNFLWSFTNYANDTAKDQTKSFTNTSVSDSLIQVRLIATTQWGCKDTMQSQVKVFAFPKSDFTAANLSSCAPFAINGSVISLQQYPFANDTYTWQILNKQQNVISTSTGTTIPTFNLVLPNDSIYYRLITSNNRGCKPDTLTRLFKTISNPGAGFTQTTLTGCHPLNIQFTDTSTAGMSLFWDFGNSQTSTASNPQVVFNDTSYITNQTYTVKLLITAGVSGCRDSAMKTITVLPRPLAAFGISNAACAGAVQTPINNSVFKTGTASFGWKTVFPTFSNVQISDTTAGSPNISFPDNQLTSDTNYIIRLRVVSMDGCVHDSLNTIGILRRPKIIFTANQPNCGPVTININNSTSNVGSDWLWSLSPGSGASISNTSIQNPQLSFMENTSNDSINYLIHLTATRSGTTCFDTSSRTLTVYPKPRALFTSINSDSCGPRQVVFNNISDAKNNEALNSMNYTWTFLNNNYTTIHAAGNFLNSATQDSLYTIQLISISKHGCKDTSSQIIRVKPNAKASFTQTTNTSCAPFIISGSIVIADSFPEANSNYQWFANDSLIGSGIGFPGYVLNKQADSVLIKLKAISKYGCKNDSMQTWFYSVANPKPDFQAIDSIVCSGINIHFNNTSIPPNGLTYQWQLGNTLTVSALKNPDYIFYNYGINDTLIEVKLITMAGGTGCMDSVTKNIVIKPLPNPDFGLSDSVLCIPQSLTVNNSSGQIPAINPASFKWMSVQNGATILNDTCNTQTQISFTDNQSGTNQIYQIRLINQSVFGCKDSVQKSIRIPTRPVAVFNLSLDSACGSVNITTNNTTSFGFSYNWFSPKAGPVIANTDSLNSNIVFPEHQGIVDSIYPIRLIATTNEGCRDTFMQSFKVFPKPISYFTTSVDSGCAPLNILLTNSSQAINPAVYFWDFGDGTTQINNAASFNKSFNGSVLHDTLYTIKLISTSANGCKDTLNKSITIKSGAVSKIQLSDTIICSNAGNPTRLYIENKSFGSIDSFYWNFGDGSFLSTNLDTNIYHPYPAEGTYTIVLKAINSCGISFDTAHVTVHVPPVINFTKTDSLGCSPFIVSFTNQSVNTYGAVFNWTFGNGQSSNLFTPPNITYYQSATIDTSYYIQLQVNNFCGVFIKQDSLKVYPKPTASFITNTDAGCSPLLIYILNQTIGIPQTIKWTFGNGDSSTRFTPLQIPIRYTSVDTASIYQIKLVASNKCGVDSMSKNITVLPNTVQSFFTVTAQNACQNLSVGFMDQSTGGNNISWNFGDGGTSVVKNPIHTYTQPGIYTAYQYVNNNCSYDTSSLIIRINPNPRFTLQKVQANSCVNTPVQFSAQLQDSGSIIWNFDDGNTSTYYNPLHAYTTPGKKIITATVTSSLNNCVSAQIDSIQVQPIPVISIGIDTLQACRYHYFDLNANSNGNYYYSWDFGDSNVAAGSNFKYRYNSTGNFTIKLTAASVYGCTDSAARSVSIWPVPVSSFDYTPKDTCNGPAWVQFTNLSSGADAYLWKFGNGNASTNTHASQLYIGIGNYPVQLISTNSYFCSDTMQHDFTIFSKPTPAFDFDLTEGCVPHTVRFSNKSNFSKNYLWFFGDGETSTEREPAHTYTTAGTYTVKLIGYAGVICLDSVISTKTITVFPKPSPYFNSEIDYSSKPYRTVTFTSKSSGGKTFEWDFGDGSKGYGLSTTHRYNETDSGIMVVKLKVISETFCDSTYSGNVQLPGYWKGLFVPNAFTPEFGSDEVRVFKPAGKELQNYHLKIYNKWGQLIWETRELLNGQPAVGWDGNDKMGNPMMQGTYIWFIEATFTDGKTWDGMEYNGKKYTRSNLTLIK